MSGLSDVADLAGPWTTRDSDTHDRAYTARITLGLFRYSDKNLNVNPKIRTAGRRAVSDPDGPDGRLRTILLIIDFGILSTVYLFVRDFSNFITIHDSRVDS